MPKDKKDRIPESKLLKALAELEDVAKGDALEEQDPEGGLSTEGEPLSDAAPKGRGEQTKKSRGGNPFGNASSSSASSDDDDGDSDDDDDDPPPPPKKSKDKDKKKVSKAASSASSDDDDDDAEKSFRDMAEDDETMRKGMLVNDFLEHMTDQLSLALLHVKEQLTKSIQEMEARLTAHIDDGLAKSVAGRREFDVRLAKGVAAIGNAVVGDLLPMADMIKSIAAQPAPAARGKAVLSKGEVNQPPWGGPSRTNEDQRLAAGSDDYVEELRELGTQAINDWLFRKSAQNQLDQNVILAFEADRYDPAFLPSAVRKAIANDLIK
jgi:hypothetical protein